MEEPSEGPMLRVAGPAGAAGGAGPVGAPIRPLTYKDDLYVPDEKKKCHQHFDVSFIIDDSDSVKESYRREKQFVVRMAKHFDIGKSQSRASLIQFSYEAKLSIKLNEYYNLTDFINAVLAVKRLVGILKILFSLHPTPTHPPPHSP